MTRSELAKLMLEYEDVRRKCTEMEKQITDAVMYYEESVEVGNVRATLRAGRKTYDYETAANDHPRVTPVLVKLHSTMKVDWKSICNDAGIKDIPFDVGNPSVYIKLLEE